VIRASPKAAAGAPLLWAPPALRTGWHPAPMRASWILLLFLAGCLQPLDPTDDLDGDGTPDDADCAPADPAIHPAAVDPYGDDLDSNCDDHDGVDGDGDGFPSNVATDLANRHLQDCDDANPAVHPGAEEIGNDGVDSDCDGTDGVDGDGDGFASLATGGLDCDDEAPNVFPGSLDPAGDGTDANCDGIDGMDADRDGHASLDSGGQDCDDDDPGIHPGAFDACDGVHSDCQIDPLEADGDADGYRGCDGDCDDGDPSTWPGAPEACDGADTNCDGQSGAADADGDGTTGCAGDCDDGDATVHPGASEQCNGRDDDCSGAPGADEADGDGDGLAPCAGDCDDGNAAVHLGAWYDGPGAPDADCDGDPDGQSLGGAAAAVVDDVIANRLGRRVAVGDFDGDGLADVAASLLALSGSSGPGVTTAGRIVVTPGSALAPGSFPTASSGWASTGEAGLDRAGASLAAGDVNGDGFDDLLIGAPGYDGAGQNSGRAYLLFGPPPFPASLAQADRIWEGGALDHELGISVALGDVDGDGLADPILGADGATGAGVWTGAVYVERGAAVGSGVGPVGSAWMRIDGSTAGGFLGTAVAAADLDGDGIDEVVVGGPGAGPSGDAAAGRVFVFDAAAGGVTVGAASLVIDGVPGEQSGDALAAGDLDGDGRDDLVVGGEGTAQARLFRSSAAPSGSTWALASAPITLDAPVFGFAGDVDGDGRADLLLGDPDADRCAVLVASDLPTAGTVGFGDALSWGGMGNGAGAALAGGDVDGDGRDDPVIGSEATGQGPDVGRAWVLFAP